MAKFWRELFSGEKRLMILLFAILAVHVGLGVATSEFDGAKTDGKTMVRCKVVPLKARSNIKADTIFSGTVLSFFIKQPHRFQRHGKQNKVM
jgi:hypothetical protein